MPEKYAYVVDGERLIITEKATGKTISTFKRA